MACNCEKTVVKCVNISPCDEGIDTGIRIDTSGEYTVFVSFPTGQRQYNLSINEGDFIKLPNELLAPYVHVVKVYDSDGNLYDDTCYTLRTALTVNGGNRTTPSGNTCAKKFITVTEDGTSLTDVFFANHVIVSISTNNQMYISDNVDFSQLGDTITWTNGNSFYTGQVILAQS